MHYAILRPTVLVGDEDILINNIAYLLRRFPFFLLPGNGSYKLQPVHVDDVATLAVEAVYSRDDYIIDAVGPDIFTFREMVQLIGGKIGARRPLIPFPPRLTLLAAQFISLFVKDVVLTPRKWMASWPVCWCPRILPSAGRTSGRLAGGKQIQGRCRICFGA